MKGIESLINAVVQKQTIEECSLQELQNITRQYPYFAPAHLLLAEKIRTLDESLYEYQLERVSLYFNNPLWLDYLLNKNGFTFIKTDESKITELNKNENIIAEETKNNLATDIEPVEEQSPSVKHIRDTDNASLPAEEKAAEENDAQLTQEKTAQQTVTNQPEKEIENDGTSDEEEDHYDLPLEEEEADSSVNSEATFNIPQLKIEPLKETESDLLFEPYHTVDYFASQGIKISATEKPGDRLSYQLKSFTEWIKTMKRLPANELENNLDSGSEEKVQSLASHSLEERNVFTEAMAEVWLKQGNREKAIDIYQKLSLQIPAKSAYFAAKIESLKTN
jgi:hypothetical protein